jgi:hypothetical protein
LLVSHSNIDHPAPAFVNSTLYPLTGPTVAWAAVRELNALLRPEHDCEPLLASDDGKWIFESIFAALKNKTVARAA